MKMTVNVAVVSLVFSMGIPAFAQQESKPAATQTNRVKTTIAPASVEKLSEKVKAMNTAPAQPVSEIIKMSDAGVDEKTVLAYIENSPGFVLKADDVIALHERGISTAIITAMLQHPPKVQVAQSMAAPPAQTAVAQQPLPVTYATPPAQPVYVTSPQVVYTDPYPYAYSYPSVIISGGSYYPRSYCYPQSYFYGGFRGGFYPHHFSTFHHFGFRGGFGGGFHGGSGIHHAGFRRF